MAPRNSQAARKEKKQPKDEPESGDGAPKASGDIVNRLKALFLESVIVQTAPKIPDLLKPVAPGSEKKVDSPPPTNSFVSCAEGEETNEAAVEGEKPEEDAPKEEKPKDAQGVFDDLCARLTFYNPLGLGEPASGEAAKKAWLALKDQELDMGPRSKRKGNPALERLSANFQNNLPQYIHMFLAIMLVWHFLIRSFFARLPLLIGLQIACVMVPPFVPKEHMDKVPAKFLVVGTIFFHGLVMLLTAYEVVWGTNFFVKILLAIPIAVHAYIAKPAE